MKPLLGALLMLFCVVLNAVCIWGELAFFPPSVLHSILMFGHAALGMGALEAMEMAGAM